VTNKLTTTDEREQKNKLKLQLSKKYMKYITL